MVKSNRGRPRQSERLDNYLEMRVKAAEKQAFKAAADLAGLPMAAWARERLRRAAIRELQDASLRVAFLK